MCIISTYKRLNGTKSITGRWYAADNINNLMWGVGVDENTEPSSYSTSNFTAGSIIGNSPYIFLDISNVAEGDYDFEYRVTSGSRTVIKILSVRVNEKPSSGTPVLGIVMCANDDTEHNIFNEFLTGSRLNNGTWSGTGVMSYGYKPYNTSNPTDDTFNPFLAGSTQTIDKIYNFTYKVLTPSKPACVNCESETTVPITVKVNCCDTELVINSVNETCTYSANILNPNDYSNTAEIFLVNDSTSFGVRGRFVVTSSCEGVVRDVVVERSTGANCRIGQGIGGSPSTDILDGGRIISVRMRSTSNPTLAVDLDLTNSAYLTGCAGTVNPADLIYNSASTAVFSTAVQKVISNAMCTVFGAVPITNFDVNVITASGFVTIDTQIKHNPTGLWCGMVGSDTRIVYQRDSNPLNIITVIPSSGGTSTSSTGISPTGSYNLIGSCGTLIVSRSAGVSLNVATSAYNFMSPSSFTSGWFSTSNNGPKTCITKNLTANVSNCLGSVTYLWSTGDTTQTIKVDDEGTYTVETNCSINNCTNEESITI